LYKPYAKNLPGASVNGARRALLPRITVDASARAAAGRDHSACGVGLVAQVSGEPSREVVELALGALAAMEHRGGVGADGEASDGAGVLTAIPWRLLEPWLAEQRVAEPRPFSTAVGMVFLPREPGKRNLARELVAKALRDEGLVVVGWRPVPLRPEALPPSVRERHPHVEQVVATSPVLAGDELERALLLARRAVGKALIRQAIIRRLDDLYICSLSSRTIVYKGMVTSQVLPEFYPDLQDPAFVSPYAVLHRRFSTNTAPKWSLAQPMRLLAHNGEINTLLGNLAWMRAREPELAAPVWGARIAELLPAVHGDSSDSGAFDKLVELLVRSGRSPLEALMMPLLVSLNMIPKVALGPLIIVWFKYGIVPNMLIAFSICVFPILLTTVRGLREVEPDLLDALDEVGAGMIAFTALAQGLLTDKYLDGIPADARVNRPGGDSFERETLSEGNLTRVRALNEIAKRRGQSLAQMAYAWVLRDPRVTTTLIGASSPEQIRENVGALDHLDFSAEELAEIDQHAVEGGVNLWEKPSTDQPA